MSKFKALLEHSTGEGFVLDQSFVDNLAIAYDEDIAGVAGESEIWNEEKLAFEAALQERDSIISRLKSDNYDLLTQLPASDNESEDNSGDDGGEDSPSFDDFFESKDD